jgi:Pectate lyase superfamily protein
MKKLVIIYVFTIISYLFFGQMPLMASEGPINVSDHGIIGDGITDYTEEIQALMDSASNQKKSLYFPQGIYLISETLYLKSHVSLLGDENHLSIIKGTNPDYAAIIKDGSKQNLTGVALKYFIFDNVIIHSNTSNHGSMMISDNVFINGKKGDLSQLSINPDSNNKNGGELTAFYIHRMNQDIEITHNVFLRDEDSKGRGIGTYRTSNAKISNNYFGQLEEFDSVQSMVSKRVQANLERLNDYKDKGQVVVKADQGHFMTAINSINHDFNQTIKDNVFALNTDIVELHYNDGSGDTLGYHRDHVIYSKGFYNLSIYGNYFKGQPNNPDGGVKLRNGQMLNVASNHFDNVPLLLYIQSDNSTGGILSDVWIENNLFQVKNNHGQWGSAISALFYEVDLLENVTVQNNSFLSNGQELDKIKFDLNNKAPRIENLHFENNRYLDSNNILLHEVTRSSTGEGIAQRADVISMSPYYPTNRSTLLETAIPLFYGIRNVVFSFHEGRLISDADVIQVNGVDYKTSHHILPEGEVSLYLRKETNVPQIVEGQAVDTIITESSHLKMEMGIKVEEHQGLVGQVLPIQVEVIGGQRDDLKITVTDPSIAEINDQTLHLLKTGFVTVNLETAYGYQASFTLQVEELPYSWQPQFVVVGETSLFEIPSEVEVVHLKSMDEAIFTIDEMNQIHGVQAGFSQIELTGQVNGVIYKQLIDIRVKLQDSFVEPELDAYYYIGDIIVLNPQSNDSTLKQDRIQMVISEHLKDLGNNRYEVIGTGELSFTMMDIDYNDDQLVIKRMAYQKPTSITLNQSRLDLTVGQEYTLDVMFSSMDAFDELNYFNTNSDVLTIEEGLIQANQAGVSIITIKGQNTGVQTTLFVEVNEIPDDPEDQTPDDQDVIDEDEDTDDQVKESTKDIMSSLDPMAVALSILGISLFITIGILVKSKRKKK